MALSLPVPIDRAALVLQAPDRRLLEEKLKGTGVSTTIYRRAMLIHLRDLQYTYKEVSSQLQISQRTIARVVKQVRTQGLQATLTRVARPGRPSKVTRRIQGELVALYCRLPPSQHAKWTFSLLLSEGKNVFGWDLSRSTLYRISQRFQLKPWKKRMWCLTQLSDEFLQGMYTLLDINCEPYTVQHPVIYLDEKSFEITAHLRTPRPPDIVHMTYRMDEQYERLGTLNIFVAVEPKIGWRNIQLTKQRRAFDFAYMLEEVLEPYTNDPEVKDIRLVTDNLNTHHPNIFRKAFSEEKSLALQHKLQWVHPPPHASWLNLAEIEISALTTQCLDQRFASLDQLIVALQHIVDERNQQGKTIDWTYTHEDAIQDLALENQLYSFSIVNNDYEMLAERAVERVDLKTKRRKEKRSTHPVQQAGKTLPRPFPRRLSRPITVVHARLCEYDPLNDIHIAIKRKQVPKNQHPSTLKRLALQSALLVLLQNLFPFIPEVSALSNYFHVSEATIRGHLKMLKQQGFLKLSIVSEKHPKRDDLNLLMTPPSSSSGPPAWL